ncbi:AfsR/SARP family transcriptional regulator [Nonomuraea rubra]|uniref:DNA-binding SARP family transcriptional activator/tetratricopeptide (TPR) repeat protein n=1 Tax=Nonomuraea rubra TaxID=46180 RepID=A0A7X0P8G9_9ACTN|nr:BTAD domain-containing putative transcriptional regulator [Nonomuraea rubra]MBB6557016.1 DNA-binding SARP family transcriptional activator/tetratricopeptide (TPR) repeat protein [Nonomuraea rubra]
MAGQSVESGLRFAVLGPVRAWRDGQELDLGTPLQRSILGMLLLREGHAVTPNEMIDAVWGEEAPPRALGALRTYVSRLRTVLEPDRPARSRPELLTSIGRGYALRLPEDSLDLTRFERGIQQAEAARKAGKPAECARALRAALALFEGEPLAGTVGPYSEHQRDRLVERRISVVETLMDVDLELGNHAKIVSELIALTADHPLRERLRAQLMLALYRCGRQGDALNVFTETREALIDELGIEPGPELSALHQRILAADPTLAAAEVPQEEEPAGEEEQQQPALELPRPAQLPAAVSDFTGRKEIAVRLRTLLSAQPAAEGVPIAAISGIGGVGKTTLAVHVAHLVDDVFPDGQLYADLRGYTDQALAPESALGGFLRALGVPPDVIPDAPAERSALYRSILAERRILVLLDNARDAAQVSPLLPGTPGCAAIVTSRGKLADLPSAKLVDLDVMEPDEALSLFSSVAGAERVAAEHGAAMDVVAACGFLPLAVRIVASRLAARPSWTVASLVPRLADEQRRLDELRVGNLAVEATFALGYGQLTSVQARAFRLLSLPNGPDISVGAASAVLSMSMFEAEEVLESLVDASLLEAPAPGRYRFHDLLKLFARRALDRGERPQARTMALRRLLGFYLASAQSAHTLAYEGSMIPANLVVVGSGLTFTSVDEAVAWLISEGDSLFAAIDQAAATARTAEQLLPAADLLVAMEPLLEAGTHTREFDRGTKAVLATAQRNADQGSELRARYVQGRVLFADNRLKDAEQHFRIVHELSRARQEKIVTGEVLNALAVVVGRQRRHTEALSLFEAATRWYRENGVPAGEALVLSYSARDHLGLGRPEDAIAAAEKGLAIFTEIGSGAGTARARYHLGIVLSRVGRLTEAVHHHAECLAFFRASKQRVWEQRVCSRLAETFIAAERYPDAVRHAEQALVVSREIGHPYGEALSLTVLGRALRGLGSTTRSLDCLRQAFDIFSRLGAPEAGDLKVLLDSIATPEPAGDGPVVES